MINRTRDEWRTQKAQIDALVYLLHGLAPEEREIVKGGGK